MLSIVTNRFYFDPPLRSPHGDAADIISSLLYLFFTVAQLKYLILFFSNAFHLGLKQLHTEFQFNSESTPSDLAVANFYNFVFPSTVT
jgi:hypothetical protein